MMEKLIENHDCIINFAAESFVDRSILDANQFLVSNIRGTYTILEILRKHKKRLIQISTDEVFGSLKEGSAHETSRFNPSNPYAATKASAELLVNSYVNTYDLDCVITRCTNNYGPRQFYEKLIPKTIFLANQNKKIPIYGKGENIRDWLYVEDHVEAIDLILHQGEIGETYAIGGNNELKNIDIVFKLIEITDRLLKRPEGTSKSLISFVTDRLGHDYRYAIDTSKIKDKLGWEPKTSFELGLEETIKYYLKKH